MAQSSSGKIHYLNIPENTIESTTAAIWTQMGQLVGVSARLQGVFWNSTTPGASLQLKDSHGEIIYECTSDGSTPVIDQLLNVLTIRTPFIYYDSEGGNKLVLFGEYVDYPDF